MQNQPFTYKEYANLIDITVEQVGVSHQSFELLLYVWQTLAGGVHHYMSHRSRSRTILMHFVSESFINAMNEFIHEYECGKGKIDLTPIPWVQSIVVIQYALGKLVYFRGQNNFPRIYRFIDDFLSAYFTKFLNYTIGDQLQQRPEDDKYDDSKRHNDLLFINQRYANWGPEDNVQGFGFIQEDFVQVIKND
jgi:hypothetical protein